MAKLMLYLGSLFFTLMLQLLMSRWEFLESDELNRSTQTVRGNDLHQRLPQMPKKDKKKTAAHKERVAQKVRIASQ